MKAHLGNETFEGLPSFVQASADGEYVVAGAEIVAPKHKVLDDMFAMPDEVLKIFENNDQKLKLELDLGVSLTDILNSGEPILKNIVHGFGARASIHYISNVKKALLELLKDNSESDLSSTILPFHHFFCSLLTEMLT